MSSTENANFFNCNRRDFLKAAGIGAAAMAFPMGLLRNANAASNTDMSQEIVETDVLVIGGGIAGIFAALKAKDQGLDVTIADKGTVGRSGLSPWFCGYNYYDAASSWTKANWRAKKSHGGEYLTNMDYVDMFIEDSKARYKDMVAMGADKANPGGHVAVLREKLEEQGIKLVERTMITELIKKDDRIAGAVGFPMEEDKAVVIQAKAVILCAGSGAFKTPGFPISPLTHDGDAMAYRIGAEVSGKEFIDFHWTHWENPASVYDNWKRDLGHDLKVNTSPEGGLLPLSYAISAHNGQVPMSMNGLQAGGKEKLPPGMKAGDPLGGVRSMDLPIVGGATAGMAPHKSEGIFPHNAKFESNITGLFAAGDALCTEGAAYHGFGSSSSSSAVQGARAGVSAAEYAKKSDRVSVSAGDIKSIKKRIFEPRTRKQGYSPEWVTQVLQGMMIPYYSDPT